MVGAEDVAWAYRLFLGREPDTAHTAFHQQNNRDRSALRDTFVGSGEFRHYLAEKGFVEALQIECVDSRLQPFVVTGQFLSKLSGYISDNPFSGAANLLRQTIGETDAVIDIGAALGWFSLLARQFLQPGGKVYAFEPHSDTFEALKRTVAARGMDDIISCTRVALGERNSFIHVALPLVPDGLGARVGEGGRERVPLCRLDTYALSRRIAVIKIDTNGTEAEVLTGAQETIRSHRPLLALRRQPARHILELFPDLAFTEVPLETPVDDFVWLRPKST